MLPAKIALVYYSRTGNTARVAELLRHLLDGSGYTVNMYRVSPLEEYSRPLHVNARVIYDTLVRKGTEIRVEPGYPEPESYDALVVASPIWFNTLTPPVVEFLRRCTVKRPLVIVTTSALPTSCERVTKTVEEIYGCKPLKCINIRTSLIRNVEGLKSILRETVETLASLR